MCRSGTAVECGSIRKPEGSPMARATRKVEIAGFAESRRRLWALRRRLHQGHSLGPSLPILHLKETQIRTGYLSRDNQLRDWVREGDTLKDPTLKGRIRNTDWSGDRLYIANPCAYVHHRSN